MKYADFEKIMSPQRMERYVKACGGDTRKEMTLTISCWLKWNSVYGNTCSRRCNTV